MTFNDIFKSGFLESVTEFSTIDTLLGMLFGLIIGLFIFMIYKKTFNGVMYSTGFAMALVGLALVTTLVIMAVTSNVVLSLGMVGALSIVRFRTAVKDPLDLVFMFWSISVGIICGAGMPGLAVILTVVATILAAVFYKLPETRKSMLLVVNATGSECLGRVFGIVERYNKNYNVKSRNLTKESADIVMEIRLKDCDGLLKELNEIEEVASVSMVAHKGEAVY